MNTKPLLEKLINNWPVKAICFILAAMIYFFHQISLLETKTFSVPLDVRKEGNMLPVDGLQKDKYIKVKIRTRREKISQITEHDLEAYVDISSRTKEGNWNFPVCVDLSEKLVQLDLDPLEITVVPDSIHFEIQKKDMKLVPLKTSVYGTPAHGYKALGAKIEPSHIFISGPQFMLDEISEIQVGSVNIDGAEFLVSKVLKAVNPNSYVSFMDENVVKVSVPIVSEAMVKEIEDVEVKFNSLVEEFSIAGETENVNVVIEGNVLDIEKFSLKNMSVYADLSFITQPGIYTVPVIVELSPAYTLAQISKNEVTLEIVKKEEKSSENDIDANSEVLKNPAADSGDVN